MSQMFIERSSYYDRLTLPKLDKYVENRWLFIDDGFRDIEIIRKELIAKRSPRNDLGNPPILLIKGACEPSLLIKIGKELGELYEAIAVRTPSQDFPSPKSYQDIYPEIIEVYSVAIVNHFRTYSSYKVHDEIGFYKEYKDKASNIYALVPSIVTDIKNVEKGETPPMKTPNDLQNTNSEPTILVALAYGSDFLEACLNYLKFFPEDYIPNWTSCFKVEKHKRELSAAVLSIFKAPADLDINKAWDLIENREEKYRTSGILLHYEDLSDYLATPLKIDREIKRHLCENSDLIIPNYHPSTLTEKIENYRAHLNIELAKPSVQ